MSVPTLDAAREDERQRMFWAREKMRCEDSLDYLATKYLRIKAKHVIGFPTLKWNRVQSFLRHEMHDQWQRTGWVRQIWGKARAVGTTTLLRADTFHHTGFKDDRNAFLCAHDEPSAHELFEIDKTFLESLPPDLKPTVKNNSKTKLEFAGRRSKILVGHSKNINVGASQMNHIVELTEVARYEHAEDIQASLFPSISDAKGADYSSVVMDSTSRYGGYWFKEFAEAARAGESEFGYEFHFIPWFWHDDYTSPVPRGFKLTGEERELKRQFKLTDGNLVWRRRKRAEYLTNPALFHQEYPVSWEESWTLPKGTLRVFNEELIGCLDQQLKPGKRMEVSSTGLTESLGGLVEVWDRPQDGVYYDMGVDIAEGRTKEADWTVLNVIRRDTLRQVAQARFHMDPASPEFVQLVYWLGMVYNTAQIIPDITGGWGVALLSGLQRKSYPNIWQWRRRDDAKEKVSNRLGFLYTERDKTILVNTAVQLTRRGGLIVHSNDLVEEMRNFLNIGLNEWGAAPGHKDDCVNAWMLALLAARDEQPMDTPSDNEDDDKKRVMVPGYRIHDVASDLADESSGGGAIVLAPWRVG